MIDCIILTGGRGLRMSAEMPKALVRVNDKELIAHQIDYLKDKVRKIIVATGYRGEEVENFLYETYPELSITCIREIEPLGTAGAIKNAVSEIETDRVLVVNCDDICDINIEELEKMPGNIICVHNPYLPFGIIKRNVAEDEESMGRYEFLEKPIMKGLWSSCGWYILKKGSIGHFPTRGSIEYNVFPKLDFEIYRHLGKWYTFNSPKDIEVFEGENR
ncbi:NTP transferase domain-containing protein [Candidatus Pacearchaeota archaeon]|nr:NTP transferase domain-containing protein [Candidatus Pacearchaeota archaeon]